MRNWKALLTSAKERGLSRADLARELGVWRGQVNNACKDHGIDLRKANPNGGRRGPWTQEERDKRRRDHLEKFSLKWAEWIRVAQERNENVNEFCLRTRATPKFAREMAAKFGFEFRTGPRRVAAQPSPI